MPKAQISIEIMLYIAMAGIALLFALRMLMAYRTTMAGRLDRYRISVFVEGIEEGVESGSRFAAYVPAGLCNATSSPGMISTAYGTYYMGSLILLKVPICTAGMQNFTSAYNATLGYEVVGDEGAGKP